MRRLLAAYDTWSEEKGKFKQVGFIVAWEEDGKQYQVEHKGKTFDLHKLKAPPPIQPEHLTTPWVRTYFEAPQTLPPSTTFIKSNSAIRYVSSHPTLLSELMRREIEVYMKLACSPHPNICPFYGCIRDGPRVSALALKYIPHKLPFVWKRAEYAVSKLSILRGIIRGLDHLHSLGIVHNDISIANICLDESLRPVIIDFGSARNEGESLGTYCGTPGWFRKSQLSMEENDLFGLGQLAKWLDGWEVDIEHEIEPTIPSSWTEDYLAPKILAIVNSSKSYYTILSQIFHSGARLTLLNDPLSPSPQEPICLLNGRLAFAPAHSHSEFAEAWTGAGRGLRSEETDVAFFPISSDILCESSFELRQLEAVISTIPLNLRPLRMQPRLILFDSNSSITSPDEFRKLQDVLNTLVQDCWADNVNHFCKLDQKAIVDRDQPTSNRDIFQNFAFVQPGGWLSSKSLSVYLWKTSESATPYFSKTPYLVAPDDLISFVLEPPETRASVWDYVVHIVKSVIGVDDLTLFTTVAAQAALTLYFIYKVVWH